ncbi:hypothetical protein tloyanaT_29620 [Thalassotalea loyana]|uniref:DUF2897 family protein n=1 Tax=Thalassotalea loyana TaxID=280483 RepID=A0ABQ6HGF5_9GAMM|nr:DUF2897 family protein [Thalassotalea loyana]GLX86709.1 hypothetical protein tloyanaT_29620 [Thalassotalea loyana]
MSWQEIILIVIVLGTVVSGVLLLKQSATKFHLTDEQKAKVEARKKALEAEESKDD